MSTTHVLRLDEVIPFSASPPAPTSPAIEPKKEENRNPLDAENLRSASVQQTERTNGQERPPTLPAAEETKEVELTIAHSQPAESETIEQGFYVDKFTFEAVWEKAKKEYPFYNFRLDTYGSSMAKHEYCKKTKYGWRFEHIVPLSEGGTTTAENLQAVHWKNIKEINNVPGKPLNGRKEFEHDP
jgi:hypothetical protein